MGSRVETRYVKVLKKGSGEEKKEGPARSKLYSENVCRIETRAIKFVFLK